MRDPSETERKISNLISVSEAKQLISKNINPTPSEIVPLQMAGGRVLSENIYSKRTQPPFHASAMDGYALLASDVTNNIQEYNVAGESLAGKGYHKQIVSGQCVRIFTGAPLPPNADTIAIQENCDILDANRILVKIAEKPGTYIRPLGGDFKKDDLGLALGNLITAQNLMLLAAMGYDKLPVYRKPRIAIMSNGDELVLPSQTPKTDQIIASNSFGIAHIAQNAGAEIIDLGLVADQKSKIYEAIENAISQDIDCLVTSGGASVGDHDLIRQAILDMGGQLDVYKIAMRPGKPFMFGSICKENKTINVMGLPGNPVSSFVCAHLFLTHYIRQKQADHSKPNWFVGQLTTPVSANDEREDYSRCTAEQTQSGTWHITPFSRQDSSLMSVSAKANALMMRPAFDPARAENENIHFLFL